MIFCTSIAANYLPRAAILAKSLKKFNKDAKIVCCLVEKEIDIANSYINIFDEIILAKDLNIPNFEAFIFRFNVTEACTGVKPALLIHLFEKYKNEEKFVYLDPDIEVFNAFEVLENVLENNQIVITPHLLKECGSYEEIYEREVKGSLMHGSYNLGFLGLKRGEESVRFLNWWYKRLDFLNYADMKGQGVFTDQKWIDLVPGLFETYILKDSGYNVAFWNLSGRKIQVNDKVIYSNSDKLVFIHFSGIESGLLNEEIDRNPIMHKYFVTLLEKYIVKIELNNFFTEIMDYSYDFFNDGSKINQNIRKEYRNYYNKGSINPYILKDKESLNIAEVYDLNKEIYIWGCGKNGNDTYHLLNKHYDIKGFIDSNERDLFNNLKVYNFEELKHRKDIEVIVATSFYKEITALMESKGFSNYKIGPLVDPIFK